MDKKNNVNSRYQRRLRINLKRKQTYSNFFGLFRKRLFFYKLINYFIHIRITPNNTIITLTNKKGEKLYLLSAGRLKLKSSKRTYKYIYKILLEKFFNYLGQNQIFKNIHYKITAPKFLRKKLIKTILLPRIRGNNCTLEILRLLPFNGCKPAKKRRKKRQGLRVFKK